MSVRAYKLLKWIMKEKDYLEIKKVFPNKHRILN
jgi:hypothetical protein